MRLVLLVSIGLMSRLSGWQRVSLEVALELWDTSCHRAWTRQHATKENERGKAPLRIRSPEAGAKTAGARMPSG